MIEQLLNLFQRVSDLERRLARMVRHGPVDEVNASEGWVRLNLGEGDEGSLLSPKIPYAQMAGDLKVHSPPSKGQNMTILSAAGDMRQAIALPMTWSDQNASPSDKGDENVLTYGSVRIEIKAEQVKLTIGGFSVMITDDDMTISIGSFEQKISGGGVASTGGKITHDGLNTGSSHNHGGIVRGGDKTDPPSP